MLPSDGDRTRTRRELLAAGASLTGFVLASSVARAGSTGARAGARAARRPSDDDLLDAGYARIAAEISANPHANNHAPMVAEVLHFVGRADRIGPWLDDNLAEQAPGAPAQDPLDPDDWTDWHAALGHAERWADWQALFARELAGFDWWVVLSTWVPRLAPGLAGAATHGLIRTAHVTRALEVRDVEARRRELSLALAYWAATYQELPWDQSLAPAPSVTAALGKVVPRRPKLEPPVGNIVTGLQALDETPSFRPVAGFVEPGDPLELLSESASVFARVYLANPGRRIPFVHAITAPSALRLLAPHIHDEAAFAARYAWQAAAGLYTVYADPSGAPPEPREPPAIDTLAARAVEQGGTHVIKLTEACLREHAFSRDETLLLAADDAIRSVHM
jgi:hypothetical protein